jgi:hypothetical protein
MMDFSSGFIVLTPKNRMKESTKEITIAEKPKDIPK